MGVIIKQSMFASLYAYIGVLLGFITSALIMPKILLPEQIGIIKLIIALIGIFTAIFSLGANQLLYRIYPKYEGNVQKRRTLILYVGKIVLIGIIISFPFYYFLSPYLMNIEQQTAGMEKGFLFFLLLFLATAAKILYQGIFSYVRMMNNITIDAFIQNIYQKGGVLLLLIFFHFLFNDFNTFIIIYLAIYISLPIALLIHFKLSYKTPISSFKQLLNPTERSPFEKTERKDFFNLLAFGVLTSIGGSLYLYIDTLMVNEYLTEKEVGIYGTVFLFGMVVIIPARTLKSISVSILSRAFAQSDFKEVATIYKKSSINLMIIGGYILLGIWCNRYSIFGYLPDEFKMGEMIILYIGLAQFFDMSLGVNNEIIAVSPRYKINTLFIILSIIIAMIANVLLIPDYGINGAGLATLITVLSINIIRLIYIYQVHKIQPFSTKTVVVTSVIVLMYYIIESIPNLDNYIYNLIYKGGVITLIYVPTIYFLKVSSDYNELLNQLLKKFFKRFKG
jgi:O-antigen/teichoic acid export membrane protein